MNEFDFGSLKKKSESKKPVKSKPVTKITSKPKKPIYTAEKKLSLDEYLSKYEPVIKAMLQLFEGHIIRHDQKNPIGRIAVEIGSLSYDPEFFKICHERGYLEKTNYTGQWRIKQSLYSPYFAIRQFTNAEQVTSKQIASSYPTVESSVKPCLIPSASLV